MRSFERDLVLGVVTEMSVACVPSWHQQSPASDHLRVSTHSRRVSPEVWSGEILKSVMRSFLRSRSLELEFVELEVDTDAVEAVVDRVESKSSGWQMLLTGM
jgi:hypothetical protein